MKNVFLLKFSEREIEEAKKLLFWRKKHIIIWKVITKYPKRSNISSLFLNNSKTFFKLKFFSFPKNQSIDINFTNLEKIQKKCINLHRNLSLLTLVFEMKFKKIAQINAQKNAWFDACFYLDSFDLRRCERTLWVFFFTFFAGVVFTINWNYRQWIMLKMLKR